MGVYKLDKHHYYLQILIFEILITFPPPLSPSLPPCFPPSSSSVSTIDHCRLLPTHRKNNTAVMVTIQHSPDLEVCVCSLTSNSTVYLISHVTPPPSLPKPSPSLPNQNGPRLLDSEKQLVATGKEEILKFISTENDSVRTKNKMVSFNNFFWVCSPYTCILYYSEPVSHIISLGCIHVAVFKLFFFYRQSY